METTPAQIDLWLKSPSEHQRLEFKEAKNQFDNKKLYKYCVALANEGGGVLLLGVSDQPPRKVVGTQAFHDPVEMAEKLLTAVGFRVDMEVVAHPDGRVLVFQIPSRPRGTAYHLEGTYLMRSGEELVPMSEDRLRLIFAEGQPDWLSLVAREDCTEDEIVQLLDTQSYFDLLRLPYPATCDAVLDRFEREKLICRRDSLWCITRLGAVLFAKRLDDFDGLARKAPRVVVYSGQNKLATRLDKSVVKGYATGFEGLLEFVNEQVPSNEVIGQALRQEVKMFPSIAIRELVANALIHQDFTETGTSVMVELYADRMEITSPGRPFISTDRFIDEYQSRNERLADLMRRLNICEEKGSGIDKVIAAAEAFQLPAPDFRANERQTISLLFAHKEFEDMDRSDRIRACYQHCCLRYVMNQKMTNQSLRERFKLPESRANIASQVIAATIEAGRIKLDTTGSGTSSKRYSRYVPFWA